MIRRNSGFKLNKEALIFVTVLLYFFARMATLTWIIRGLRALGVLIVLIAINYAFNSQLLRLVILRSKWIILSLCLLILSIVFQHGNSSDLSNLLFTYFTAYALFVIGSCWGLLNKTHLIRYLFLWLFSISVLNMLPFLIVSVMTGIINKESAALMYGIDASSLIFFWPYFFLIGFSAFFYIYFNNFSKIIKRISLLLFILYFAMLIVSAYAAVLMMFSMAIVVYFFLVSKKNILFSNLIFPLAFTIIVFFGLQYVGSGALGELGGTTAKINAFVNIFQSGQVSEKEVLFDQATSTRWSRLHYSWKSINHDPFFGVGYEFESSFISSNYVASGHSSIFDFFAYFGIFAIFFILLFYGFIKDSYLLLKMLGDEHEKKRNAALFGMLLSFFIISFMNPYFSYFVIEFVFFIGGWVCGQIKFKQNTLELYNR